jgi:hypothetical protein
MAKVIPVRRRRVQILNKTGSLALVSVTFLGGSPAQAEVEFEPSVTVGVAHSDNITLVSVAPEAETIYELIPEFSLHQEAPRLTTDVAYRVEGYRYDRRGDNEVYNQLDSSGRLSLDPDNFFLDFGASRSQSIRDPEGVITLSNLPINTNRIDQDDIYFGPALQYAIGSNATVAAEYRRSRTRYDDDPGTAAISSQTQDFDRDEFSFSIDNYRRGEGVTWAVRLNSNETDYGIFMPWEFRQATLELGGWVGQRVRLFASGGKESAWDQPFDPSLDDSFWEAGFSVNSGDQFSAEFAAGERTFGSSRRASLDLSLMRLTMQLSYGETPTTQGNNPYDRGGLFEFDTPDDFLSRPGTAERYISERFDWSVGIELRSISFSFSIFDESRTDRTSILSTPLDDEEQSGAYADASWSMGTRTSFTLGLRTVETEFGATSTNVASSSLGASYSVGPRTDISLEYEHMRQEIGDSLLLGAPEYRSNVTTILFTRRF